MKKLLFALLAALILTLPAYAYSVPDDTVVYVTDHGEKYHREDCTYTSDSAHPMTIEKAEAKGYTPCSRCDPDRRTGEYVSNWDGESGSSGSSKSGSTSHASTGTSTNTVKKKLSGFGAFLLGVSIPVSIVLLLFLPSWIRNGTKRRQEAAERERRFQQEKKEYTALYSGKRAEDLAKIPPDVEIGPDGLPKISGEDGWGSAFTFYTSYDGYAFHRIRGCSGAHNPTHACLVGTRYPCRRCFPQLPDLSWHKKYLEIQAIKKKYNID